MLLKNFYKMCLQCGQIGYQTVKDVSGSDRTYSEKVTPYTLVLLKDGNVRTRALTDNVSQQICLGTGDTPVTYNDYTLSGSLITSGFNATVTTSRTQSHEISYHIIITATAQIIIKEIAYLVRASVGDSTSSFIIERTVLPTPISLLDTESAIIDYAFSLPNA